MNGLYDLTLGKLGNLSRETHVEVYSYFDVLTEVCIFVGFLRIRHRLRVQPDLLENGAEHHRRAHWIVPARRERVVAILGRSYWKGVR